MTKPHEQEWRYEPARKGFFGNNQHVDADGVIIPPPDAGENTEALLRLIAAAPAMARARLAVRAAILSGTLSEDAPEVIERALRKAGAL